MIEDHPLTAKGAYERRDVGFRSCHPEFVFQTDPTIEIRESGASLIPHLRYPVRGTRTH